MCKDLWTALNFPYYYQSYDEPYDITTSHRNHWVKKKVDNTRVKFEFNWMSWITLFACVDSWYRNERDVKESWKKVKEFDFVKNLLFEWRNLVWKVKVTIDVMNGSRF